MTEPENEAVEAETAEDGAAGDSGEHADADEAAE